MAVEALENLMLDTLELELAKIGTAPTSNWRTTTPPTMRLGVPGDRVPGPNLMTLQLQHLRSERGDDSVGTASHRLRVHFAVWVFSSHAADGQRRMLNLLEDVRQALLAAEDTLQEQFSYGLNLGAFQFTGDEALLRAGISGGALELTVDADTEHPASSAMTEAAVRELIKAELMSPHYRQLSNNYALTSIVPGVRSAGFTDRAWGSTRAVTLPVGVNKIWELTQNSLVHLTSVPELNKAFTYSVVINAGNTFATPSGEALVGIQWGSFQNVPPFQTTYVSSTQGPVFQLRFNYTRAKFELLVWNGDNGAPPTVTDLTIQTPFTPDLYIKEFKMEYLPAAAGGSVLNCYLNGELGLSYSGADLQDCFLAESTFGPGIFMTGGDSGTEFFSETGFFDSRIYTPGWFAYPSPPNP